jgi:membrane associated rhomboid family serine protease
MPRFPRSGPTTIAFPPFRGVTSRLVGANVALFFLLLLLQFAAPATAAAVIGFFALSPASVMHGWIWQFATYSFLNIGVLHVAFNMLALWFIGSYLEAEKGSRWLLEAYFLSAVGGAAVGSALCWIHLFGAFPGMMTAGSDGALMGVFAAFAVFFGDLEMYMFPLPVAIKARYLVIVYMLIDVALLFAGGEKLAYFTVLGGALAGFLYARSGPRRGAGAAVSEKVYGLRNEYYRWKRRRAARKFEVYMRRQNRDVRFDREGRYIDPDENRDPNDRKWMN